mmetsp:Transcript_36583/g.72470  ORF Transcript_36583/g.72470 Transcript_36583/m.72470 type:complete len:247 (-) Transcript_36583:633-1373(-)
MPRLSMMRRAACARKLRSTDAMARFTKFKLGHGSRPHCGWPPLSQRSSMVLSWLEEHLAAPTLTPWVTRSKRFGKSWYTSWSKVACSRGHTAKWHCAPTRTETYTSAQHHSLSSVQGYANPGDPTHTVFPHARMAYTTASATECSETGGEPASTTALVTSLHWSKHHQSSHTYTAAGSSLADLHHATTAATVSEKSASHAWLTNTLGGPTADTTSSTGSVLPSSASYSIPSCVTSRTGSVTVVRRP